MLRKIVRLGDSVLEARAKPVQEITSEIADLVRDMAETMYKAPGVGLAAPQIGVSKRVLVTDTSASEKKASLITLINPEIVAVDGEQYEEEGCLSIPGFTAEVTRPRSVSVRGIDLEGKEIVVDGKDLLARAFCHEIDHLNGVLFLEHLSFIKRDLIKRKVRKLVKQGEW